MATTHRERRKGRFRPRRLAKRALWLLGFALGAIALLAALLFFGFRSDYVWRQLLISRYFGPYWETALSWESMTPRAFPPGVTFEKVVLREPGDNGRVVLSVDRIHAQGTWQTRPDYFDFESIEVDGVSLSLVKYAEGDSNARRAITRLFEGLPPDPSGRDLPRETRIIPRIKIRQAALGEVSLHLRDLVDDAEVLLRVDEPTTLRFDPDSREFAPGRLDDFLGLIGTASLHARRGELAAAGRLDFDLESASLGRFPKNDLRAKLRLSPAGNDHPRLEVAARVPLERTAIRAIAVPFEDLEARLLTAGGQPLASFTDAAFDPLRGAISGALTADLSLPLLRDTLLPFLEEPGRGAFESAFGLLGQWLHSSQDGNPARLSLRTDFEADGVAQYAAVDPAERMPFRFAGKGAAEAEGIPIPPLAAWLGPMAEAWNAEQGLPQTGILSLEWDGETSEREEEASVRVTGSLQPEGWDEERLSLSFSLDGSDGNGDRARLNPYHPRVRELLRTLRPPRVEKSDGEEEFLPQVEQVLAAWALPMLTFLQTLEAANLDGARFRQNLKIADPLAIRTLLDPLLVDVSSAEGAEWGLSVMRGAGTRTPSLSTTFTLQGLRLEDFAGTVNLDGAAGLHHHRDRLQLSDFQFHLQRDGFAPGGSPAGFHIQLAPEPIDGRKGPVPPTYFDVSTRTGHAELTAGISCQEIAGLLLRVRPFGIPDRIARPLPQALLHLLGTESDGGGARVALSAELGPTLDLATRVALDRLPVRGEFLGGVTAMVPEVEIFGATLFQRLSLDRENDRVTPGEFLLTLHSAGREEQLAALHLESVDDASLDYGALLRFVDEEMEILAGTKSVEAPTPLRRFALSFLDRANRLHQTMAGGRLGLLLEIPHVALADLGPLLPGATLPASVGTMDLELRAALDAEQPDSANRAEATLDLHDLQLDGMEQPLPPLSTAFTLQRDASDILLDGLQAAIQPPSSEASTNLSFGGSASTTDLASSWRLTLTDFQEELLPALLHAGEGGLPLLSRLMVSMPTQRLAEVVAPAGRIDLHFEGQTSADGTGRRVSGRQEAASLPFLPRQFRPLSFTTEAALTLEEGGAAIRLDQLGAILREEDCDEPWLRLSLADPLPLRGHEGFRQRIPLMAATDLDALAPRLADFPLPLYARPLSGGKLTGDAPLILPGALDAPEFDHHEVAHEFTLSAGQLALHGWDRAFQAELSGRLENGPAAISLSRLEAHFAADDEPAGTLQVEGHYHAPEDSLSALIDLIGFRGALLEPLPPLFARWSHRPGSHFDLQARLDSHPGGGTSQLQLAVRARDIGLAPVILPDGTSYSHPPLHLDMDALSDHDADVGVAVLRDFQLFLSGEAPPDGPRLARLDRAASPLLSITQAGPLHLRTQDRTLTPREGDEGSLRAEVGPLRIEDHGILLQQILGLPLVEGRLEGTAELMSATVPDSPANRLDARFDLAEGVWNGQQGRESMEATISLRGALDGATVDIDEFDLRAEYPSDAEEKHDHFTARGTYDAAAQRLRLGLHSEHLSIDRLVRFAGDLQTIHSRLYPHGIPTRRALHEGFRADSPGFALGILETLDAEVDADIDRMSFDEISLGRARAKVTYRDSRLVLQELLSRAVGSRLALEGAVSLTDPTSPWHLDLDIANLDSRPWINTFGPAVLRDKVDGRLTAKALITGRGFTSADLRRHLETNLSMTVREGRVSLPQVEAVVGKEGDVEAELRLVIRGNRAVFDLVTPWNPWRHLSVRGRIRNVVPDEGEESWYQATARIIRTTPVGPAGRTGLWRGEEVPFRQELYGLTVDSAGRLSDEEMQTILRNIIY